MNEGVIFLDKDGTIVDNVPYNVDPARISLAAGVVEGLRLLHLRGYRLVVISNQSGVAQGYFTEEALAQAADHLRSLLHAFGVPLAGFYYCPHHPDGRIEQYKIRCACRKPEPGLLLRAAAEHNANLAQSWFIGDTLSDVEAGRKAGCRTILIDNGNEAEWKLSRARMPHHTTLDLAQAARLITALDDRD